MTNTIRTGLLLALCLLSSFVGRAAEPSLIKFGDARSIADHRPIIIAHRGGVVSSQSHECSLTAIRLAAEAGYDMVELDVQKSRDGVPVVFHDQTLMKACGKSGSVANFQATELEAIPYLTGGDSIVRLETALKSCRQLGLGVMLDLKAGRDSREFLEQIDRLLVKHELSDSTNTISGDETTRRFLKHVRFTPTAEEMRQLRAGEEIDLRHRFWFGLPKRLQPGDIDKLKSAGALIIPAINTFRYPEEEHLALAQKDIESLTEQGVDGFQIDSIYFSSISKQKTESDVLVIGGTPAGISAAIAAGRAGKSVMLIEQSPVLGGMLSSGVIRLDDMYVESNSGVMEEFRRRVRDYHRSELAEDPLVKAHLTRDPRFPWNVAEGRAWEPHTAARIYAEMVAELDTITTRFNEVAVDVEMNGDRVTGVITQDRDNQGRLGNKHTHTGKVIIDATYEADLAEFAKIPYRIGREARSKEEPHAGRIYTNFFRGVPGTLNSTILPESTGEADHRSQAFTYRLTGKDYGTADHAYRIKEPPPNYDPAKYQWNRNNKPIIPNGKFDLLGISWGGDLTGYGTRWVLADWEERVEIEQIFRNYDLGWLYYIQTEGGSPNIGIPDDEFTDNHNLPYRLYVRQGRRIDGHYTLTESDIHKDLRGNGLRGPINSDSVAIGVYGIDAHNVQGPTSRKEPRSGEGAAEGTLHLFDVTGPYQIPYGVMVPKEHQGILFPVGISSTHVAMCTVRMEPVWSALGQAAGVAAALAVEHEQELDNVPVNLIQDELVKQGAVLFFYTDLPKEAPAFEAVQKLSLRGAFANTDPNRFLADKPASNLSDLKKELYHFRPDDRITLGEFARLAVNGLQIPLSISAAHFNDVSRNHPDFKFIETLYNYSTQSHEPFLKYEVKKETGKSPKVLVHPDQEINGQGAAKILSGLLKKDVAPLTDANLTRSEAGQLVYELLETLEQ